MSLCSHFQLNFSTWLLQPTSPSSLPTHFIIRCHLELAQTFPKNTLPRSLMTPRVNPWDPFCLSSFLNSWHTWPVLPSQKGWSLSFDCIVISSFSPYSSNLSFYLFGPILLDVWVILGSKNVALFPPSVSFGSLLIVWVMFRCHIPVTLSWRG